MDRRQFNKVVAGCFGGAMLPLSMPPIPVEETMPRDTEKDLLRNYIRSCIVVNKPMLVQVWDLKGHRHYLMTTPKFKFEEFKPILEFTPIEVGGYSFDWIEDIREFEKDLLLETVIESARGNKHPIFYKLNYDFDKGSWNLERSRFGICKLPQRGKTYRFDCQVPNNGTAFQEVV